jgi:hypothetical protein
LRGIYRDYTYRQAAIGSMSSSAPDPTVLLAMSTHEAIASGQMDSEDVAAALEAIIKNVPSNGKGIPPVGKV